DGSTGRQSTKDIEDDDRPDRNFDLIRHAAHQPIVTSRCQPAGRDPPAHRVPPQWPRNASSNHQEPRSAVTFASTTSGRPPGDDNHSDTPARSAGERTVRPAQPYPSAIRARSVSGNVTVSSG